MANNTRKITIRFHPDQDADLLSWYDTLRGEKGRSIKQALRRALLPDDPQNAPQLDAGNLLAEVREVVEIAIQSALEEYALPAEKKAIETEEDVEAENLLNALIQGSKIELDSAPEKRALPDHW